ncbi:MAG: hypothetical protein WA047_20435 [Phenylobacterium sp.]|uniref:hypothetical protein n=1 Tax=Phenylobacterium sp. TaxID=1871053 RepID=UPI003BB52525
MALIIDLLRTEHPSALAALTEDLTDRLEAEMPPRERLALEQVLDLFETDRADALEGLGREI